jgi:hypothetical protein
MAYLLSLLRTWHLWLADYTKIRSFSEDNKYECGVREKITYILVYCRFFKS